MSNLTIEKCVEFLREALARHEVEILSDDTPAKWYEAKTMVIGAYGYEYRTKPKRVEGWVNVYPDRRSRPCGLYSTELEARNAASISSWSDTIRQVYVCEPE